MIQTVFFDLGWTLVKPRSGDWTFTECFFSAFPQIRLSDLRSEPLKGMISTAFAPLRENPYMRSVSEQIRRYDIFFRTFCSLAGLPYSDELIRELAEDISLNDRNMVPVETALETLRYLKENGYVIGVISDTWPNIETQLDALGMTPYFDTLTYSYRLGTNKPSPMMFQDALGKTGTDPRKCVFIDDIPANLEAAEKFGIRAVQSLADPDRQSDVRFPSIRKPADLIGML